MKVRVLLSSALRLAMSRSSLRLLELIRVVHFRFCHIDISVVLMEM